MEDGDAALVAEHLEECSDCRRDYALIRSVSEHLASITDERLRPDEAELLRAAAISAAERTRRGLPVNWTVGLASAAAILLVLAVAIPIAFRAGGSRTDVRTTTEEIAPTSIASPSSEVASVRPPAPHPAVNNSVRRFENADQVEMWARNDPTLLAYQGYFKAADVGRYQRYMQEEVLHAAPPSGEVRSPAQCMNDVFRSVPRPLLPALVQKSSWEGTAGWVIVFAFTFETEPDAPLSGSIFYAFDNSCIPLASATWS